VAEDNEKGEEYQDRTHDTGVRYVLLMVALANCTGHGRTSLRQSRRPLFPLLILGAMSQDYKG